MGRNKYLKVGLFNAGSLGTKHDEFQAALLNESPDIFAINETWLKAGEDARAPSVPGYRLRHLPRPRGLRKKGGGGVGFFIKNGIIVRSVQHPITHAEVEQMWVCLNINTSRIIIGTAYRAHWVDVDIFLDSMTDSITSFGLFDYLILLGDFNLNMLDHSKSTKLKQFLDYFNLKNHVTKPTHFTTHSETLIDLVISDAPLSNVEVIHIPELGGHAMVLADLKIKKEKIAPKIVTYRPLKDINILNFNDIVNQIDWDSIANLNSVNDMVSSLSNLIVNLFDAFAPEKTITLRGHQLPWLTSNVRYIMQLRNKAHTKFRLSHSEADKDEYKKLKSLVNCSIYSEKVAYFNDNINKNIGNGKKLWKNLKSTVLPDFNGCTELPDSFNDPNLINQSFLNIPGENNIDISHLTYFEYHRYCNGTFRLQPVHENEVAKIILRIKSNATGSDMISRDMILLTLPSTLKIITAIINSSIREGVFPSMWKSAIVRPIPKKSNPTDLKDLRPISILPYLSKILEKVVYNQVVCYCESNHIFPDLQSGFRKNRSTATALLDVVDNLLSSIDKGKGSILTLLDFSRAFDSINFNVLLSKLTYYGFDSFTVRWFESYLTNRSQRVVLHGKRAFSHPLDITRGVPQGSILGPLLFIIYSADIVTCINNSNFHLYADDLQIYIPVAVDNINHSVNSINEDLHRLHLWSLKNSLVLNPTKSKFLIVGTKNQVANLHLIDPLIHINGKPLQRVSDARNLGILFDENLKFEKHVIELARNCFYRLKVLYSLRPYVSVDVRLRLCESLVLSKLNYCIGVYGPCLLGKSLRLIQRVQNACARFCFQIPPRTHVTPYLNNFNILKMQGRQNLLIASLLFDVIKYQRPGYLYKKLVWRYGHHRYSVRTCSKVLFAPKHRTSIFRGSFRFFATKCWNDIPPPIREAKNKHTFKNNLRIYLLNQQKCE